MKSSTFQMLTKKYDQHLSALVTLLPAGMNQFFIRLGRMTLPSIWAGFLVIICLTILSMGYSRLAFIGAVIIGCIPIGTVLKLIIRRLRPDTLYAKSMKIKSYSFPSSHTYSATVACGFLGLLTLRFLPLAIGVCAVAILIVFAVIIGISRVYIGAHYPTDVIAGWIVGVVVLYLVMQLTL